MNEIDLTNDNVENQLLEVFGDKYLINAIRIVSNNATTPLDNQLIHESLSILIAMYLNKVRSGEINKNKVFH